MAMRSLARSGWGLLLIAGLALTMTPAMAADKAEPEKKASAPIALPDDAKVTLLIQLHMAALSLANITGQYGVLHALGSPKFQSENSAEKLAKTFASFRSQSIDISPTLIYAPVLSASPRLEGGNRLLMTGWYDTKPNRVLFDLAFEVIDSNWRLAGIAVRTEAVAPGAVVGAPQASRPEAGKTVKAADSGK